MAVKLRSKQLLEFLTLKGGCTGWSESTLVKMPHCWKSHALAQILFSGMYLSSLDKQRICVNKQLKSSKKQLKLNVCLPKSNSVELYAITCDVIAYLLVHFNSICVIYKCQPGIDFFY